jgi:F420-dependent oxidoreductase-like protein
MVLLLLGEGPVFPDSYPKRQPVNLTVFLYDASVKLGMILPYEGGLTFPDALELTERAEALGFDSVWVPEAWGTDAISILGALAARTDRIRLGTGIVNVFSRTPALLAQTAATLDLISNGRFILGLGTSGHQVVAGWHGVPFDRPLARMRETVAIVRQVLRRDPLRYSGEVFALDQGLKLLVRPVRAAIPIFLATLTPAGMRLTGEVADGWIPTLFMPEHGELFRPYLEEGARLTGRSLDSLEIAPYVQVMVDEDRARARDAMRPWVALYVGGMGSRAKNYYNEVVSRYGFGKEARNIQELYLTGKKLEAIRQVPDALVDGITIAGPPGYVRDRMKAWGAAGVTLLLAGVQGVNQAQRLQTLEILAAAA